MKTILLGVALVAAAFTQVAAPVVPYDIVYVRAPRAGDDVNSKWPDVFQPTYVEPGSDLMLLHPDGSEEVLVKAGKGAVTDPCVSFDGEWVYYSLFPDVSELVPVYSPPLPRRGADIYKLHLKSRKTVRLTNQEYTPNTAVVQSSLPYGVYNLGACPLAGGRIVFSSNRNGFVSPKPHTPITMQLYVMDEDGENVTPIAPMTLGSALHPFQLADGRLAFSTHEPQGLRDSRVWALWSIWPDGREWAPLFSAFGSGAAFHFSTQLSNGDVVVEDYYNANNNGFGALYGFPAKVEAGQPGFYPANVEANPRLRLTLDDGTRHAGIRYPFTPRGAYALTPFTHSGDAAAPRLPDGTRAGKVTHPSAAPENDLLLVWTPGPANNLDRPSAKPYNDAGIYLARKGAPVERHSDLVRIKNDPRYNEQWPRAVVTYQSIHGRPEPVELPWLPNDGTLRPELPPGSPYGIIGTSSFLKRESAPGNKTDANYEGLDAFNAQGDHLNSNWEFQGSDAGKYSDRDVCRVRLVMQEPTSESRRSRFFNHANERMRVLGDIPLRKTNADGTPVLDPEGNVDTSFWAKIPADTPFTFQMTDCEGRTLTMAQTWHQVRPGEIRTNCGGCHAHSQKPLAFEGTAASKLPPVDLTGSKPRDVEFLRDIRPILQKSCVACHKGANAPAGLRFDDTASYAGLYPDQETLSQPGDYMRLARDASGRWGYKPVTGSWNRSNASRYVRKLQSRRSLLIWKIVGRRLDGWTNEQFPTERVQGDATTLPRGAVDKQMADLDYNDTVGHASLLDDDSKRLMSLWIDLGASLDSGGYFDDELRPIIAISSPRPNENADPLKEIRIGLADAYSGLALPSLRITADVAINGRSAGYNLAADGKMITGNVFVVPVSAPIKGEAHLRVEVKDVAGNRNENIVRFWIKGAR